MHEIELKFGLPATQLDAVRTELARLGADIARPQILQAAYFDTPDRRLAQARAALRVRREDDEWVQTFKSAGLNTMVRVEDNQPATPPAASADGEVLRPDLSRHNEAARQVLMQALGWQPERDPPGHHSGLVALYRTDMRRTRARLTVATGTPHEGMVELALDEGAILAGGGPQQRCEAVCELEIELLSGAPQAVILAAEAWVERFGLWLDTQTKAHRGDRLARRVLPMPERTGTPPAATNRPTTGPTTTDASCDRGGNPPTPWPIALESALGRYTRAMSTLASPSGPIVQDTALAWRDASRAIAAVAHTESAQPWAHDLAAQAEVLAQRIAATEPNQPEMLTALARSADATRLALAVFTVLLAV